MICKSDRLSFRLYDFTIFLQLIKLKRFVLFTYILLIMEQLNIGLNILNSLEIIFYKVTLHLIWMTSINMQQGLDIRILFYGTIRKENWRIFFIRLDPLDYWFIYGHLKMICLHFLTLQATWYQIINLEYV